MTIENDANSFAGLTEEERAALAEDDAPAPKAADEAPAEEESAEALELRNDPAPILNAEPPKDAGAILDRIERFEEDIEQQYNEGDITAREYRDGLRKAAEARDEIRWALRKAEFASEAHEQAVTGAWRREVDDFMNSTAKAILDKGEPALVAFDQYVKRVTGDPANQHLSDRAQLEKAHKLFLADFGGAFGSAAEYQPPGYGPRDVGDGGRFAALDRLAEADPIAYEKAVAKMSEAEQAEYLRSA